ncbi:hypothetical protein I8748_12025 [Nostoc sp. CENA67]|uniref:Uncharacterized protein n=1 Tax=Amazonocrinis nigriterrae CENA67 TaxID=2794033 RepID=A0A8J7HUP3_9NOST|nr:hypothetical protein [Amazonocrinis nigriterrae]MBH8562899.1 hypothetical protein [Amazonocrinis nigriterrae CENA67]
MTKSSRLEVDNLIFRVVYTYKKESKFTRVYEKSLFKKILNPKVLTSCFLSMFLSMGQTALAGYQPPKDQKPPAGHSDSSGVRGTCKTNSERSLVMLASVANIEKTNSFGWFVTNHQPVAIQFQLYKFDISATNNPFVETNTHPEAGIDYIAHHEVVLPTSKQTIDRVLASFLTNLAKLENHDKASI